MKRDVSHFSLEQRSNNSASDLSSPWEPVAPEPTSASSSCETSDPLMTACKTPFRLFSCSTAPSTHSLPVRIVCILDARFHADFRPLKFVRADAEFNLDPTSRRPLQLGSRAERSSWSFFEFDLIWDFRLYCHIRLQISGPSCQHTRRSFRISYDGFYPTDRKPQLVTTRGWRGLSLGGRNSKLSSVPLARIVGFGVRPIVVFHVHFNGDAPSGRF
ncbi:hypothetical protein C8R43DRAFT_698525 [Mycena crocata]|nr:hypothetical protein C8R43DRAFT_698525 [Mycena crocata]